ncbi:hypothetical protein KVR01_003733 [Diaporthe batatas]|uniref:uncharacterized protein n=1 Tax=Diaporthe batatas TaxID=748121 RepID=UPI001D04EECB|nr:uncharacterized protein KVR01_003733 [Diaporthe batatas]KAG8168044.1 hypothetical protein KVR01_003733 [Diaporthe batatas]
MSAIQGVFGALLGSLNFLLKYGLLVSCCFFAASTSFIMEGGSYLGVALNLAFFGLFFGLVLASNPNSSRLGHTDAKVSAVFFWLLGCYFLHLDATRDTIFLREATTICMAASVALMAPVARREASVGETNEGGDRPMWTRNWKTFPLAMVLLASVVFISSQSGLNTPADGILAHPMIVNDTILVKDTILVNDTITVNDICLLPPEVPAKANLTIPSIPVQTPDFITTLGTPCQVTPTPAPPSPVPKSTWVPAAMSTAMPTPEPAPTALPEEVEPEPDVEPQPEPEPEPEPQPHLETVAAPQDVAGALELLVRLSTSQAKSILSPQAKSAVSWYLSFRVEDRCTFAALAVLLAWYLLWRLVNIVDLISACSFLPTVCFLSLVLCFCLDRYELPRSISLAYSVGACVIFIVAIVVATFVAYFLRFLRLARLVKGNAAELPMVKSDISKVFGNLSSLESTVETVQNDQSSLGEILTDAVGIFGRRMRLFERSTATINLFIYGFVGLVQRGIFNLHLRIGALSKRVTGLKSRAKRLSKQVAYLNKRIGQLQRSKADSEVVKRLAQEMEDLRTQLDGLENNGADDEARKKLEDKLNALSATVKKLGTSLGSLIDEFVKTLCQEIKKLMDFVDGLRTRVDGIEEKMDKQETEREADNKARTKSFFSLQDQINSLRGMWTALEKKLVGKEDLKKVKDDVDEKHNETKKAIDKQGDDFNARLEENGKARREEQAAFMAKVEARCQATDARCDARCRASEDKVQRIQNKLDTHVADSAKREKEQQAKHDEEIERLGNELAKELDDNARLTEKVEELKYMATKKEDAPQALHPDVVRQIKVTIQTEVASQLLSYFGSRQFLLFISGAVMITLQRLMAMGINIPSVLSALRPGARTAPQPGQPASGTRPVPPAPRFGKGLRHFLNRSPMFRGGVVSPIWSSFSRRQWPTLVRILAMPGGDRLLSDFIATRIPRSLPPPGRRSLPPALRKEAPRHGPGGGGEVDPSKRSDPPTPTHGSSSHPHESAKGDPSQGSDAAAPGPFSSEAEGSLAENGPDGNTTNDGDNSTGSSSKIRVPRTDEQEDASRKRSAAREALLGFHIDVKTGKVTDPNGSDDPVACVLAHGKAPNISEVGPIVDCETETGLFRRQRTPTSVNRVVAKMFLPNETKYTRWFDETYTPSLQPAATPSPSSNTPNSLSSSRHAPPPSDERRPGPDSTSRGKNSGRGGNRGGGGGRGGRGGSNSRPSDPSNTPSSPHHPESSRKKNRRKKRGNGGKGNVSQAQDPE